MAEIPYGRLAAIESALGGRAAVQRAYEEHSSLVGGGGGGGGGGATLQTSFLALTYAAGGITDSFIGIDEAGFTYDNGFVFPHAGVYLVTARFADSLDPIRATMVADASAALAKNALVIWSLQLTSAAKQGDVVTANPVGYAEYLAGVWAAGSDPTTFAMSATALWGELTILAENDVGDGTFGHFSVRPSLRFVPLDGSDPYLPALDGQAVLLVGCVPV